MKYLLLILIGCTLNAQNLVQNPSFELNSGCPENTSAWANINFWTRVTNTTGSPDYFHTCGVFTAGVPSNSFGNQQPFYGSAYVGLYIYGLLNFREYLQTQLSSPMIAGQSYLVSFYVSCADAYKYGSNNIGAIFSVGAISGNGNVGPLNITPHIYNQTPISDTSGWTMISGTYVASGNEQYMAFGNFYNDASTQIVIANPTSTRESAYYYIDQVSVVQLTLGNSDFLQQKYQIVPNPVVDKFTVVTNQSEVITNIELYSQYSRVKTLIPNDSFYHVGDLASGIYYLILTFESNRKSVCKIIKL